MHVLVHRITKHENARTFALFFHTEMFGYAISVQYYETINRIIQER